MSSTTSVRKVFKEPVAPGNETSHWTNVCDVSKFYQRLMEFSTQHEHTIKKLEVKTVTRGYRAEYELCHEAILVGGEGHYYDVRIAWYPHRGLMTIMTIAPRK